MRVVLSILGSLLVPFVFGTTGVDLSSATSDWSCLHQDDAVDFMITRAWMSYGAFDSTAPGNLKNAQAAGIPYTDVYLFPCTSQTATYQVDTMMTDLANGDSKVLNTSNKENVRGLRAGVRQLEYDIKHKGLIYDNNKKLHPLQERLNQNKTKPSWRKDQIVGATYGMIWLDIEYNPSSGCGWGTDYTNNCNYVQQLASAVVAKGKSPGIYSSQYEWETVMGSVGACTQLKSYPLWYAHYDNNPSFSDYSAYKFGGWTSPAMKQYNGDTTWCSTSVDLDWY